MSAEILTGRGTTVQHRLCAVCNLHYIAITLFVYPSADRTLLLQERTGHLGLRLPKLFLFEAFLFFCFVHHFDFLSGLPLHTSSQTPVPGSPFPVLRSPFSVPACIGNIDLAAVLFRVG